MIAHDGITRSELDAAFAAAHIPDDAEIVDSFEIAKAKVITIYP